MFLKSLIIQTDNEVIREINFRRGLNLIIDETPLEDDKTKTGNNVGKTTILKLIYFCLGNDKKNIYTDLKNGEEYSIVKKFLNDEKVFVKLTLADSLDFENSKDIIIERNFLDGKDVSKINGETISKKDLTDKLKELIFPEHKNRKPTFKEIISHNIRYKDENLDDPLRTLDAYTKDVEYETLFLFLFGCNYDEGEEKGNLLTKLKEFDSHKKILEKDFNKNAYIQLIDQLNKEIIKVQEKIDNLNINENFKNEIDKLDKIKYQINNTTSKISLLNIRKNLILESEEELKKSKSDIDLRQLKMIYQQARKNIDNIQRTFDDLVSYHNSMIDEKIKFITKELPTLENEIDEQKKILDFLLHQEKELSLIVKKIDTIEDLKRLSDEKTDKSKEMGKYEQMVSEIEKTEQEIEEYNKNMENINNKLYSNEFQEKLLNQIKKFNDIFSDISSKLYGENEKYLISYDKKKNKDGREVYKFHSFNRNFGSGKKQGETLCFDIAYTLFADKENISCLHFILNDKKELMDNNQLVTVADFIENKNIQLIISILQEKLPLELKNEKYYIIKLSQNKKLFKIEEMIKE